MIAIISSLLSHSHTHGRLVSRLLAPSSDTPEKEKSLHLSSHTGLIKMMSHHSE